MNTNDLFNYLVATDSFDEFFGTKKDDKDNNEEELLDENEEEDIKIKIYKNN